MNENENELRVDDDQSLASPLYAQLTQLRPLSLLSLSHRDEKLKYCDLAPPLSMAVYWHFC